jgi:hypothetical protein
VDSRPIGPKRMKVVAAADPCRRGRHNARAAAARQKVKIFVATAKERLSSAIASLAKTAIRVVVPVIPQPGIPTFTRDLVDRVIGTVGNQATPGTIVYQLTRRATFVPIFCEHRRSRLPSAWRAFNRSRCPRRRANVDDPVNRQTVQRLAWRVRSTLRRLSGFVERVKRVGARHLATIAEMLGGTGYGALRWQS